MHILFVRKKANRKREFPPHGRCSGCSFVDGVEFVWLIDFSLFFYWSALQSPPAHSTRWGTRIRTPTSPSKILVSFRVFHSPSRVACTKSRTRRKKMMIAVLVLRLNPRTNENTVMNKMIYIYIYIITTMILFGARPRRVLLYRNRDCTGTPVPDPNDQRKNNGNSIRHHPHPQLQEEARKHNTRARENRIRATIIRWTRLCIVRPCSRKRPSPGFQPSSYRGETTTVHQVRSTSATIQEERRIAGGAVARLIIFLAHT